MPRGTFKDYVLPFLVFPMILSLGIKFMYMDHIEAGISDKVILELCTQRATLAKSLFFPKSYIRSYTFIPSIDSTEPGPCAVVAFFHLLLDAPKSLPRRFLVYLLGNGLPCALLPLLDALRPEKRHSLLRWPIFWLMITQGATMAMTFPVYFLLFIISEEKIDQLTENKSSQSSNNLENLTTIPGKYYAIMVGILLGAALPSAAMVLVNNPWVTWAWQFYPLYVAFFRDLYSYLRPIFPDQPRQKRDVFWVLYLGSFVVAAFTHMHFIFPLLFQQDFRAIFDFLIPIVASPGFDVHPTEQGYNFFKWDYFLGTLSILAGFMWSMKSSTQLRNLGIWYVFALPLVGPGGAIMGVLIWRDFSSTKST